MRSLSLVALAFQAMLVVGVPTDRPDRRAEGVAGTCFISMEGVNSEGGGGPGQAPENLNNWSITLSGPAGNVRIQKAISPNEVNGGFDFVLSPAEWGGVNPVHVTGQWNYGGNHWYQCQATKTGSTWPGHVGPGTLTPGTVSQTIDHCAIAFDCMG